jgi:hypothetical protein
LLDSVATRDVLDFVHLAPGLRNLKASYTSDRITGSKLSALQQLTSLQLRGSHGFRELHFDPAGLANKGQLRRLQMDCCDLAGENAGVAALLSQLQQMKQLTHLALRKCWLLWRHPNSPPAAAYAALTASSALQHLDVSDNTMPQGVWQHVLPAGRQLPQLRVLHASHESCGTLGWWTHADTARLASCCPNLQAFKMHTPHPLAADVLPPLHSLQQLTALETGRLDDAGYRGAAVLTQLSKLDVWVDDLYGRLLPLTRLQRLTHLYITGPSGGLSFLPEVRWAGCGNGVYYVVACAVAGQ